MDPIDESQTSDYRPRSEISESEIVILLGAGASKSLGLPLMRDFWQLMREDKSLTTDSKAVLDKFAEGEKSYPDLERMLDMINKYLEYYGIMFEDPRFGWDENELWEYWRCNPDMPDRAYLSEYIFRLWNRWKTGYIGTHLRYDFWYKAGLRGLSDRITQVMFQLYWPELDPDSIKALYSPLFQFMTSQLNLPFIPVFTTNYDPVIETYCQYSGANLENGFWKRGSRLEWEPSRFDGFAPIHGRENIVLFKLHGSLSWRREDSSIFDCGLSLSDGPRVSAIIYPTQTKEYPNEEPFKTAYAYLEKCLSNSRAAVVIGYSFRDPSIGIVIRNAERQNEKLHFIVISGSRVIESQDFLNNGPQRYSSIPLYFEPGEHPVYLSRLDDELSRLISV